MHLADVSRGIEYKSQSQRYVACGMRQGPIGGTKFVNGTTWDN